VPSQTALYSEADLERGTPILELHRADPIAFMREILGVNYVWPLMETLANSVRDNRRTAVAGCHDSSKTFTAAALAWWWVCCFQPAKVIITSPKEEQLKAVFWADLRTLYHESRVPLGGDMLALEWRSAFPDTAIYGMTARKDTGGEGSSGMQGYKSPRLLLIMDEAVGIDRAFFDSAKGLLGAKGCRWLALANPTNPNCGFRDCWRHDSGWNTINISAFDTPNILAGEDVNPYTPNTIWLEEMRKDPGEGTPGWDSRVLGRFPTAGINTLISIADLDGACERPPVQVPGYEQQETFVGVDLAGEGDDYSVIAVVRNDALVELEWFQQPDLTRVADRAIEMASAWGIPKADAWKVSVDKTGFGLGAFNYMGRVGWYVNGEDFGSNPMREDRYYNRRTELWAGVRDWLRSDARLKGIKPNWRQRLESDLCGCTVEKRPKKGVTVFNLEKKEFMKKRLGHSPDHGDALSLAVAWRTRSPALYHPSDLLEAKYASHEENPRIATAHPEDRDHPGHAAFVRKHRDFYEEREPLDTGFYGE
jgi:hypothetical protein